MQKASRTDEILEMIVCPACHGPLLAGSDALRCEVCRKAYPIEDGIPILLVSRARTQS